MKKMSIYIFMIFSIVLFATLIFPLQKIGEITYANDFIVENDLSMVSSCETEPKVNITGYYSIVKGFNVVKAMTAVEGEITNVTGVSAIYVENGAVFTMTGGAIRNCEAEKGAAVYVASGGTLILEGGVISGCKGVYGGAIYVENGGTVTMVGGSIESNNASNYGGAVYLEEGARFTMTGGLIEDCSAGYLEGESLQLVGKGGAVYLSAGSSFTQDGGNIYHCGYDDQQSVFAEDLSNYVYNSGVLQFEPRVEEGKNHNYVTIADKSYVSTCLEHGNTHYYCTICKLEYDQEEAYGEHQFTSEVIAATCIEGEYTKYTCTLCGEVRNSDKGEALGHSLVLASSEKPYVCSNTEQTWACQREGCDYTETRTLEDASAHEYDEENIIELVEADCATGTDGYVLYTCKYCSSIVRDTLVAEHNYEDVYFSGNCVARAEHRYTCSKCGDTYSEYGAYGSHSFGDDYEIVSATCTAVGYRRGTCTICGEYITQEISALGHSYSYTVTTQPTCTATGTKTGTCTRCGATTTASVSALGHSYSYTTIVAATCTSSGSKSGTCTRCGATTTATVSALGHSWSLISSTASTCSVHGSKKYICSRCSIEKTETLALNSNKHNWVSGVVEPTCTEEGYTGWHCSWCGQSSGTKTDIVEPLGHNFVDGVCSRCGELEVSCINGLILQGETDEAGVKWRVTGYTSGLPSEVVVPATYNGGKIYAISISALENCTTITSLTLSDKITTIETRAFNGCSNLSQVTFSTGLTTIGANAFYGCPLTGTVTLPSTLTTLGKDAFNCTEGYFMVSSDSVEVMEMVAESCNAMCLKLEAGSIVDVNGYISDFELQLIVSDSYSDDTQTYSLVGLSIDLSGAKCTTNSSVKTYSWESKAVAMVTSSSIYVKFTVRASTADETYMLSNVTKNLIVQLSKDSAITTDYSANSSTSTVNKQVHTFYRRTLVGAGYVYSAKLDYIYTSCRTGTTNYTVDNITYEIDLDTMTAKIVLISDTTSNITIPSTISYDGETIAVNHIATYALSSAENITQIVLPASILTIEDNAFVLSKGNFELTSEDSTILDKVRQTCKTIKVTTNATVTNATVTAKLRLTGSDGSGITVNISCNGTQQTKIYVVSLDSYSVAFEYEAVVAYGYKFTAVDKTINVTAGENSILSLVNSTSFSSPDVHNVTGSVETNSDIDVGINVKYTRASTAIVTVINYYVDGELASSETVNGSVAFGTATNRPLSDEQCNGWFYDIDMLKCVGYSSNLPGGEINVYTKTATLDKLTFYLYNNYYQVAAANEDIEGEVVIPRKYNGVLVSEMYYRVQTGGIVEIPISFKTVVEPAINCFGPFYKFQNITNVYLPSSITKIPDNSFSRSSLNNVNIHDNIEVLAGLSYCVNLNFTSVYLPNSLKEICGNTFSGNTSLTSIYIPASVIYIDCTNGTSMVAPMFSPFYGCSKDLVIYCEADGAGDSWHEYWNYYSNTEKLNVKWGYSREAYLAEIEGLSGEQEAEETVESLSPNGFSIDINNEPIILCSKNEYLEEFVKVESIA